MTILILNWRDIKNPSGGGAELLTHEMAKRWVQQGHTVIQFSSMFKSAKSSETIDGVQFIRRGSWWNVQCIAFFYYMFCFRKNTDAIIDEVHWFPFFSVLYARKKTIALVCEVANRLFYRIFPYPIARICRLIEKMYLKVYKNTSAMAISQSTCDDLLKEGHNPTNLIIIPMGLTAPLKIKQYQKEKVSTLIYVARLNKQKGILDALEAFFIIKKSISDTKLWIVGSGDVEIMQRIKAISKRKQIEKSVKLFGFVSEEKKYELLSKAHILISPSAQEGWGLTVPEAGLTKTPSVVYNIQGFRDIIIQDKTGLLVNPTPEDLAKGVISLLQSPREYKAMQKEALKMAKHYSWDKTAHESMSFIKKQILTPNL